MSTIRDIDDLRREKEDLMRGFISSKLFEVLKQGDILISAVQKGLAEDWPGTPDNLVEEEVKRHIADLTSGLGKPTSLPVEALSAVPVYPPTPPSWPPSSTHCLAVGSLRSFGRASYDDAGFVVLAGSEFSGVDDPTISNDNYRDIWLEIRTSDAFSEGTDGKLISTADIEFSSAALAATVVKGVNGKTEDWEDARRQSLKSRGRGKSSRYLIREQSSAAPSSSEGTVKPSMFTASATSTIAMQASAPQLEFNIPGSDASQPKGSARPGKKRSRRRR